MIKKVYRFVRTLLNLINYVYFTKRRKCRYILVDTPEHENIGDHAIAFAERQLLEEWFGRKSYFEISAACIDGWERAYSSVSPKDQIVLVHGGGFLGTIWPSEERRFRRILSAFSNHRVVVFPQTITFDNETPEDESFLHESVRSWSICPDLTICCRERQSFEFVERDFPKVRAVLTPDIVLGLKVPTVKMARRGILFCMRSDRERSLNETDIEELRFAVERVLPAESLSFTDTVVERSILPTKRQDAVSSKLTEFSSSRLVITDRLHGMIFAAITGTPCIALNNDNGKVGRVYEWIAELPYITFAQSVSEAIEVIEEGVPEPGEYPLPIYRKKLEIIRNLLLN